MTTHQIVARIKRSSKYWGQTAPDHWFDVRVVDDLGYRLRGNDNNYRLSDVALGVRLDGGLIVDLASGKSYKAEGAMPPLEPSPHGDKAALKPNWAGEFRDFNHWVSQASRLIDGKAVCIDMKGRRCLCGGDFMRARDENAFPVRYFWNCEPQPEAST